MYYRTYVVKFHTSSGEYVYAGKHTSTHEDPRRDQYVGSGTVLRRSIRKYGKGCISTIEWFDHPSEDDMNLAEVDLIEKMKAVYEERCVNLHEGGMGGNTRKHMSLEQKKAYNNSIKESLSSPEVQSRKVASLASTNAKEHVRKRRSESASAMHSNSEHRERRMSSYGSEETRQRMSDSARRSWAESGKKEKILEKKRKGVVWHEPMYSKLREIWISSVDENGERLKYVAFSKFLNASNVFEIEITPGMVNRLVGHFVKEFENET